MSLAQFFEDPKFIPVVQAEDYHWQQLWGRQTIQEFVGNRTEKADCIVKGYKNLGYHSEFQECTEAWLYSDGVVLMCCTISSFGGTFASHDNIEVAYFGLTPKKRG